MNKLPTQNNVRSRGEKLECEAEDKVKVDRASLRHREEKEGI